MPSTDMSTAEFLLAEGRPDDIAVIDRTGHHSYAELRDQVALLSHDIGEWGLEPGSRIGLLSRNSLFWAAAYLAILGSGHVAVPFATGLTPQDVASKAAFVGCDSFLVDRALTRRFEPALAHARQVRDDAVQVSPQDARPWRPAAVDPDADAVLVFTSGTTSAPRAVRVTHRNIQANTDSIISYLDLRRDDRMLVVLPFSYCFGASLLHTHLRVGASVSLSDSLAYPETVIEAIDRDACTGFAGVPSSYQLLLRASSFASRALPSLRHLQQAGGRLPQPQIDQIVAAQPHARLFVMYGQTEATARLSYLPPELLRERQGSIGKGVPGVTLGVLDADGVEVDAGVVGQIVASGASIAKGYWDDPQGTSEKFVAGTLRTGDLGRVDEDGFIYVVDRQDDFIKSWGFRISSHEIEDAVLELSGVAAAAVVGRPDDEAGEAIVAYYTVKDGEVVTAVDVLTHCRSTLARHQVPHEAHEVAELPTNQNGKVVKSTLRQWAARGVNQAADPEKEETLCAPG
ncbi:class I adenylate-forming enzyme family protein [Pseudactinotalea terrae]|uniref:class I adenylate-forming enzyme family protein n=1 Tax=Pseudactinotalea terrae TaxID=1743262 RepID=UPI0019D5DA9A|nr:AMP-binding protein [Pseudactinotalea terrae]